MASYLTAADPFVGIPYRLHGRTPPAWDCRGCVEYLRREIFGKAGPSLDGEVSVEEALTGAALAEAMERHVRARLSAWSPVPPRAGAVALLTVFGRDAHVGLLLDRVNFIHVMEGCETVVNRLDEPRWKGRVEGTYDG